MPIQTAGTVKYSHLYLKFCGEMPKKAMLLQVFKCLKSDLSLAFIHYDTEYIEYHERHYYQLPEGTVLVLMFVDEKQQVFTTVRSHDPDKEKYYRGLQGKWLDMVLI